MIVKSFRVDGKETGGWLFPGKFPFDLAYKEGVLPDKEEHFHDDSWECFIGLGGSAEITVGGEKFFLTEGKVFLIEPGEKHSFQGANAEFKTFILNIKKG